jgi:hypothetical protein
MNFVHQEGPLGDYLAELNEQVEKTPVYQFIQKQIDSQDFVNPTLIEQEIVRQTALLKGYHHMHPHQKQRWIGFIKPIIAVVLILSHWIVGLLIMLTFFWKDGQQWAYNYKFGLEFGDWRGHTLRLDQLIKRSLQWIKESEIVSRGYRLHPRMTPIEHLEQQIRFQTNMELRRMLLYVLREQLIFFHQLEFTNADYAIELHAKLGSSSAFDENEDPIALRHLKCLYQHLIDKRITILYFWNTNRKLTSIPLKHGSIAHVRTLNKKTQSMCQALEVTLATQQSRKYFI